MHIHIHTYIRTYICTHIQVYTHIHTYIHTYIRTYNNFSTCVCTRAYARTYVWKAWHDTHAQSGMRVCTCVRTDAAAAAAAATATAAAVAAALCPGGLARSASSTRTYMRTYLCAHGRAALLLNHMRVKHARLFASIAAMPLPRADYKGSCRLLVIRAYE